MNMKLATPADKCQAGWTAKFPRPTATTYEGSAAGLQVAQNEWDEAEELRKRLAVAREKSAAEMKSLRDAQEADRHRREQEQQQRRDRLDAAVVDELRRGYLAADPTATEEGFQAALPELREARRRRLALEGDPRDVAARASFARQYTG